MGKGKDDDLEIFGVAIWKQTSKKLVLLGDSWKEWLRQDGGAWRSNVGGLCPSRVDEGFD